MQARDSELVYYQQLMAGYDQDHYEGVDGGALFAADAGAGVGASANGIAYGAGGPGTAASYSSSGYARPVAATVAQRTLPHAPSHTSLTSAPQSVAVSGSAGNVYAGSSAPVRQQPEINGVPSANRQAPENGKAESLVRSGNQGQARTAFSTLQAPTVR